MPYQMPASGSEEWGKDYNSAVNSFGGKQTSKDFGVLARQGSTLYDAQSDQNAQASRQNQMAALAQQYAAAQGNGPSAAAAQQQAMGGQALLSALANRNMGAASGGMNAAAQQAAALRSQEMSEAMRGYGEGTGQLRGGDLAYQQSGYNLANAQNAAYRAQAAQNQSYVQGMEQHAYDTGLAWTKDAQARHGLYNQKLQQVQDRYRKGESAALAAAITLASLGAAAPVAGKFSDAVTGN